MTDGAIGEPPGWYRLLKAAQYLQVAPWDLQSRSFTWVLMAEHAQDAEAHARKTKEKPAGP